MKRGLTDYDNRRIHTHLTRLWLEARYCRDSFGNYSAHEPIYGPFRGPTEPGHSQRLLRIFDLLMEVGKYPPGTILDIGGSEGYFGALAQRLFGHTAINADVSIEACRRSSEIFALPSVSCNATRLPFADNSFDLVVCSEVVEHLANPVTAFLEMQRVCRGTLVVSTEQWFASSEEKQKRLEERSQHHHFERNIYGPSDFEMLLKGCELEFRTQRFCAWAPESGEEAAGIRRLNDMLLGRDNDGITTGGMIAIARRHGSSPATRPVDPLRVAAALTEGPFIDPAWRPFAHERPLSDFGSLVSPICGAPLRFEPKDKSLRCGRSCCRFDGSQPLDLFVDDDVDAESMIRRACRGQGLSLHQFDEDGLCRLDAELSMPPSRTTEWRFEGTSLPMGWSSFNVGFDSDRLRSQERDPQLLSPWLGLELKDISAIEVDYTFCVECREEIGTSEVFFWLDGAMDFTQEKAVTLQTRFQPWVPTRLKLSFPLSLVKSQGDSFLVKFRFDPMPFHGWFVIHSIAIV